MNLFEVQERLKDFSKDQLVGEMQTPSGTAPPYLVLSELQRRTRMEQSAAAAQGGAPQTSVAEDAVVAAGVPQAGIAGMARALAPQTDVTQNTGATPVAAMADGGLAGVSRELGDYRSNAPRGDAEMTIQEYLDRIAIERERGNPIGFLSENFDSTPFAVSGNEPTLSEYIRYGSLAPPREDDAATGLTRPRAIREQPPAPGQELSVLDVRAEAADAAQRVRDMNYRDSLIEPDRFPSEDVIDQQRAVDRVRGAASEAFVPLEAFGGTGEAPVAAGYRPTGIMATELNLPQVREALGQGARDSRSAFLEAFGGTGATPAVVEAPEAPSISREAAQDLIDSYDSDVVSERLRKQMEAEDDPYVRRGLENQRALVGAYGKGEEFLEKSAGAGVDFVSDMGSGLMRAVNNPLLTLAGNAASVVSPETGAKILRTRDRADATATALDRFGERPDTPLPEAAASAEEAANIRNDAGIAAALGAPGQPNISAVQAPAPTGGGTSGGGTSGGVGSTSSAGGSAGAKSDLEKLYEQDKWLALAQFGTALMSSQKPTFGQAVGDAGQAALAQVGSAREKYLERKQAAELMAMKRAAAARSGRSGGGSGGGLSTVDPLDNIGISASVQRTLGELQARRSELQMQRSGMDEGGFFRGPDARIKDIDDEIDRVSGRINAIVDYSAGGGLSNPEPSRYSTIDVR